ADYFSTLACLGLMRVCPLDSPVMEFAIDSAAALTLDADHHYASFVSQQFSARLAALTPAANGDFLKAFSRYLDRPDIALAKNPRETVQLLVHYNEVALRCDLDVLEAENLYPVYTGTENPSDWPAEKKAALENSLRAFGKIFK